jgi:hypothetical protein
MSSGSERDEAADKDDVDAVEDAGDGFCWCWWSPLLLIPLKAVARRDDLLILPPLNILRVGEERQLSSVTVEEGRARRLFDDGDGEEVREDGRWPKEISTCGARKWDGMTRPGAREGGVGDGEGGHDWWSKLLKKKNARIQSIYYEKNNCLTNNSKKTTSHMPDYA